MTEVKIADLTATTSPADTDLVEIAIPGVGNRKLTWANLKSLVLAEASNATQSELDALSSVYQPLDSDLTALAGLSIAADKLPYGSGSHAMSLADFTAFARTLLDDATAAAARATLGLPASAVMCWGNNLAGVAPNAGGAVANANRAHGWRVIAPISGTLSAMYALVTTQSGNIEVGILDTVTGGTRTRLWTTGSIACPAVGWQSLGNPALSVTAGQAFDFYWNADGTTAALGRNTPYGSATYAAYNLPASFWSPASIATRNYAVWQRATQAFPVGTTVDDTDLGGYIYTYSIVGLIT